MNNGYAVRIKDRINSMPDGTVFLVSDFSDIADDATIRQNLKRMVDSRVIRRILNGVYEKPIYSRLLGEYVESSPQLVAMAIARGFHWTIAPCGNSALNLLGLSTQVPAGWSYVSDGPYRTYQWGNFRLEFRHCTNKDISGYSYKTNLVVQALKTIGKNRLDSFMVNKIAGMLSVPEKERCLAETMHSTTWIRNAVRRICVEDT